MSGIYFIVWDNNRKDKSEVLKTTIGGYPHTTFFYSGEKYNREKLLGFAKTLLPEFVEQKVKIVGCRVHSLLHQKSGKMCHYVLMDLDDEFSQFMTNERNSFKEEGVFMDDPHITHSIHWVKEEAEERCAALKRLLPIEVMITGVTID